MRTHVSGASRVAGVANSWWRDIPGEATERDSLPTGGRSRSASQLDLVAADRIRREKVISCDSNAPVSASCANRILIHRTTGNLT